MSLSQFEILPEELHDGLVENSPPVNNLLVYNIFEK